MSENVHQIFFKMRFVSVGVLVLANLFLLSVLITSIANKQVSAASQDDPSPPSTIFVSDSPNAVTDAFNALASTTDKTIATTSQTLQNGLDSTVQVVGNSVQLAGTAVKQSGKFIYKSSLSFAKFVIFIHVESYKFAGSLVYNSAAFSARMIGNGITLTVRAFGNVFGILSNAPLVSSVLKPAQNMPVPTIANGLSASYATQTALPVTQPSAAPSQPAPVESIWPIRGEITTLFGVPHWPYQPTHSGLDISSGNRSGVTPVKAFRSGRVVETVQAGWGLGNHVIVDHGNGLTSVYAHLYSISVSVGQVVDTNTTLGTEGSTGASTGTHLHFEIRVNGQTTDPRPYLHNE